MTTILEALRLIDAAPGRPVSPPQGVPVSFEPADLAARLDDQADLVIAGVAASIEAGVAWFRGLADGRYDAELVGPGLTVELRGPVVVANGAGRGELRAVNRGRYRFRARVDENGKITPFRGELQFVTGSPDTPLVDGRTVTDDEGIVEATLRKDRPVELRPATHMLDESADGWQAADTARLPVDGDERVVLKRAWNVRLTGPRTLAGQLVLARGQETRAARFSSGGEAHLLLPRGQYRLTLADRKVDPEEISVGADVQTLRIRTGSLPAPRPTTANLLILLRLPRDNEPEGLIEVAGPDGATTTLAAEREIDLGLVRSGRYTARLLGHSTLDAEGAVQIRSGRDARLVLTARPGERHRWRVSIPGADVVSLRVDGREFPLGEANEELFVPNVGPARAVIGLVDDLLISPLTNSGTDASFEYAFDGTVVLEQRTLLVYPDGWAHETGPGGRRVRLQAARAVFRVGRRYQISNVTLRDGDRIVPPRGPTVDRPAVDALLDAAAPPSR